MYQKKEFDGDKEWPEREDGKKVEWPGGKLSINANRGQKLN